MSSSLTKPTRNSLVQKLTGTTWGASASCLRTTALALVYSTTEYCAPVWTNSVHTSAIDTQLNQTLRLITGCLKPTPTHWLPALSNIAPAHLRREKCLQRELAKAHCSPELPIHQDLEGFGRKRLKSRNPPALLMGDSLTTRTLEEAWTAEWEALRDQANPFSALPLRVPPAGFEEPRRVWSALNRLRTGVGNCGHHWYKWGWSSSSACSCGHPDQTINHIILECPLTKYTGDVDDFKILSDEAVAYLGRAKF
ncbi:uncharacterized protein LOC134745694 [Cydia strobilella]|uniref:uncharacterized protein LOC134745694 n=1 Tax=Cydia strobilella TaxID=1100964 RepID=UPI003005CEAA